MVRNHFQLLIYLFFRIFNLNFFFLKGRRIYILPGKDKFPVHSKDDRPIANIHRADTDDQIKIEAIGSKSDVFLKGGIFSNVPLPQNRPLKS